MRRWRAQNPSWLLEIEMDALAKDSEGNTPLHWACARGHLHIIRQLESLASGAVLVTNAAGAKPVDCAKSSGHVDIVEKFFDETGLSKLSSVSVDHTNDTFNSSNNR